MVNQKQRISALRTQMEKIGLDAYIVPSGDEFMNEYVPPYARRLEWLTGFTGSSGVAVVLSGKAAFFTDGRYTLQASSQLPEGQYQIFNTSEIKPIKWLRDNLSAGCVAGVNPMLHSQESISKDQQLVRLSLCEDLIDIIWHDKPEKPLSIVDIHPEKYTGKSHFEKISAIINKIEELGAENFLITAPDSICWLLNIRGDDVPNTPLVLARMLLSVRGHGVLFVDVQDSGNLQEYLGKNITIQPLSAMSEYLENISGKKIILDKNSAPCLFFNRLAAKNTIIADSDPCIMPKACKNNVEVQGTIDAHLKDGAALTSFLFWLEKNHNKQSVTEISAAEKLLEFRKRNVDFVGPSFDTIAGFASNGAIVHYKATENSNKQIVGAGIFLLDSGGQYFSGTTDVTRTIAIGTPTHEQKRNFTLVLKGHIAIATAVFPIGTTGHQLDILARQFLWKHLLDYDHGTGHGVGSFLGVHEGPQRISKAYSDVALMPGMIISNEPGYYKNGEYGIRIENLVVVEEASVSAGCKFLKFKTLTCVPIDQKLIDFTILNEQEKNWLRAYHTEIYNKLSVLLAKEVAAWLKLSC